MADIKRSTLLGKLNPILARAFQDANTAVKARGNPSLELLHWIHQLFQEQDSDLHRLARHYGLDASRVASDLTRRVERLPVGNVSVTQFSSHLFDAIESGWKYATLLFDDSQVRSGYLVVGLLMSDDLRHVFREMSEEFEKISADDLANKFHEILAGSPEEGLPSVDGRGQGRVSEGTAVGAAAPSLTGGKMEALSRYSRDLTEAARKGEMDPVLGRDAEIRLMIQILSRRRQNNPILTGEAGVGKTAVVEGFAQRVVKGDVPDNLKHVVVRSLDVGLLQAGAGVRGEFEQRLRGVIDEVEQSPSPIILFIDEAHSLIGAGGSAGAGDAANLLKPALARGRLKTIAATTWTEYKKYIEKDPALTRRFEVVKIEEPSEENAIAMLRGIARVLEGTHGIAILDEALEAAVRLSSRYIPARQLPDKAVSLLDTACARVMLSLSGVPPRIEDARRRIHFLELEQASLDAEARLGHPHAARLSEITAALADSGARLKALEARWDREQAMTHDILEFRKTLRDLPVSDSNEPEGQAPLASPGGVGRLQQMESELRALQSEEPLVHSCVDESAVAAVVADWTGIPVGRMVQNTVETILTLADRLGQRVLGQRHALEMIADSIQASRAGTADPAKPIGVFLLAGPSGVGKTETALALAEALYGGEKNLITINMSEFQERHTVSTLKGAPPGYVGYGEGGRLTEAVRRRPYSVILLDEVEKAHPDVHEIFFQVFDKGSMEDGEGRRIDFRNTIILLTTNAGDELIMRSCMDPDIPAPAPAQMAESLQGVLNQTFPMALLGRMVTVPFYPLGDELLRRIARLQLARIESRLREHHGAGLSVDDAVIEHIVGRCAGREKGARMISAILNQTLLPEMSRALLSRMVDGDSRLAEVRVSVRDERLHFEYASHEGAPVTAALGKG